MTTTLPRTLIASALGGALLFVSSDAQTARAGHWGYEGAHGPAKWGSLDPAYAACDKGKEQSPIDIAKAGAGTSNPWTINYRPTSLKIVHHEHVVDIVDNGHTIQLTVDEGSTLTTGRNTYQLKQFHFHTPSEHTIEGKSFAMEVHFVHQSADGNFAVLGALFAEGPENENLAKLIASSRKRRGILFVSPRPSWIFASNFPQTPPPTPTWVRSPRRLAPRMSSGSSSATRSWPVMIN